MSGKMHPIQPFFVGNTTRYYKKVIPDTPYVHFYTYTADAVSLPSSTVVPSGCAEMLFTFHEGRAEGHQVNAYGDRHRFATRLCGVTGTFLLSRVVKSTLTANAPLCMAKLDPQNSVKVL